MSVPEKLYHYTCQHGHEALGEEGALRPGADGFVWLTDLGYPIAKALGLTSYTLNCDRTKHRYEIADSAGVVSWIDIRSSIDQELVWALELAPGAMPQHWFLSTEPVPARYSPIGRPRT